jgi:hypothetical protein
MGEVVQAQQRGNQSVVEQALGALDPTPTRHDGEDVSQKQVGGMIAPVIVVGPANEELQEAPDLQTPAKALEQTEAPKASKTAFFEGENEFPGTSGHTSQTYLKSRFVKSPIYIDQKRYS